MKYRQKLCLSSLIFVLIIMLSSVLISIPVIAQEIDQSTCQQQERLGTASAQLAESVVGASYNPGGQGWDSSHKFVDSSSILSGYGGSGKGQAGLDCSGLIFWAFNKAEGEEKITPTDNDYCIGCPVGMLSAGGQKEDKERFTLLSTSIKDPLLGDKAIRAKLPNEKNPNQDLKPGDLLFVDTRGSSGSCKSGLGCIDHVAMYVGDGKVVHASGSNEITKMSKGAAGEIIDGPSQKADGHIWWYVHYLDGTEGWSAGDHLELVPTSNDGILAADLSADSKFTKGSKVETTTDITTVRSTPSTSGAVTELTLQQWLDLPAPVSGKYRDYFAGYGRISMADNMVTVPAVALSAGSPKGIESSTQETAKSTSKSDAKEALVIATLNTTASSLSNESNTKESTINQANDLLSFGGIKEAAKSKGKSDTGQNTTAQANDFLFGRVQNISRSKEETGTASTSSEASLLLDRIAIGEGATDAAAQEHGLAGAYDITYAYGQYNPKNSKKLTEMTIGEVKLLQQQMLANQAGKKLKSSAVGKYQLISTTLEEQQKKLGLSDDTIFDAATQDLFGLSLLEKRGYTEWTEGAISNDQFQKNLAKEWASVADPDTGMSHYGQSVGTTDAQIKETLAQAKSIETLQNLQPSSQETAQETEKADTKALLFGISQGSQPITQGTAQSPDQALGNKFRIGDKVETTDDLNVRSAPGLPKDNSEDTRISDPKSQGSTGTILQGPISEDGFTWWEIQYDDGTKGWSQDKRLESLPTNNSEISHGQRSASPPKSTGMQLSGTEFPAWMQSPSSKTTSGLENWGKHPKGWGVSQAYVNAHPEIYGYPSPTPTSTPSSPNPPSKDSNIRIAYACNDEGYCVPYETCIDCG